MIFQRTLNIAIVVELPSEKWWPVKIPTVSDNGSIPFASRKKIFQKNGTVPIAKNNAKRQRTLTLAVILLTNSLPQLDND